MTQRRRSPTLVQKSFGHRSDDLGRRVVHGASMVFTSTGLRMLVSLGSTAILARLLVPADFGHAVMAMIVTEFAALLARFGFGSILVQRPRVARIQYDTVFWTVMAIGAVISTGVFAFSFFAHLLFDDPVPGQLLRVLAISFVIAPIGTIPNVIIVRRFMFRQDLGIDVLTLLCRAGVAIAMAAAGFGAFSLAGGSVAGVTTGAVATAVLTGYMPRLRFSRHFLLETWRVNTHYFVIAILGYVRVNVDLALVGRMLGAAALGLYQNARSLPDELRGKIVGPLQRVLFPAYSAIQNDLPRFRSGVLRSNRIFALIMMPVGFGIAAVADELVRVIYGRQWLAMIPLLMILAPGTGLRAAGMTSGVILQAANRVDTLLKLMLWQVAFNIGSVLVGSRFGLTGVAVALLVSAVVNGPITQQVAYRVIGLRVRDQVGVLLAPLASAAAMFVAIRLVRPWFVAQWPAEVTRLVLLVALGAVLYVLLMLATAPRHREDVVAVAQQLRARRRR